MTHTNISTEDSKFLAKQNLSLPLSHKDIKRYLPHRYPFVFVDRVIQISPHNTIVGYKNISNNEPCFTGHFPENPIFPGVYIIEAMAQLAGILGFVSDESDLSDGSMYLFAGVDKVRFKKQVTVGDQLLLKATAQKIKRNIYTYQAVAYVDDSIVATADIMLVKQPIDTD